MQFQGYEVHVDPKFWMNLLNPAWYIRVENGRPFVVRRTGTHYQYFHRWIYGGNERVKIAHVNGNTLDNRLSNLAPSYPIKNSPNVERYDGRWRSRITVDGALRQKYFRTEQEAREWWLEQHQGRITAGNG